MNWSIFTPFLVSLWIFVIIDACYFTPFWVPSIWTTIFGTYGCCPYGPYEGVQMDQFMACPYGPLRGAHMYTSIFTPFLMSLWILSLLMSNITCYFTPFWVSSIWTCFPCTYGCCPYRPNWGVHMDSYPYWRLSILMVILIDGYPDGLSINAFISWLSNF